MQIIGPSAILNALGPGGATGGLDAQLARLQKELSDCVNCATANTASGKAKIQAIQIRVDSLKARLEATAVRSEQNDASRQILQHQQLNQVQAISDEGLGATGSLGSIINTRA